MGNMTLGIPESLKELGNGYRIFIETGTYKGGTAKWAAQHFEEVYSIEGYRERFEKTAKELASQYWNLTLIYGDSRVELRRLLGTIMQPCMFWLDAHWCGKGQHDSVLLGDECPLREELNAINNHPFAGQHLILIDDARLFVQGPPEPHDPEQWPDIAKVTKALARFPREIWMEQDVIIARPKTMNRG